MTPARRAKCMVWLAGMRSRSPLSPYAVFVTQRQISRVANTFAEMLDEMMFENTDCVIATVASGGVRE